MAEVTIDTVRIYHNLYLLLFTTSEKMQMRYYRPERKTEKVEKEILPEWVVRLKEYFQNNRGEQKAERRDDMPRYYASK